MSRNRDNLGFSVVSSTIIDIDALPDLDPAAGVADLEDEDDPYKYGWRWETAADGSETLRQVPLAYQDLLSPEVGDFIAESTIHHKVVAGVAAILERRYAGEPKVAVWSDLKISFKIPGSLPVRVPTSAWSRECWTATATAGAFATAKSRER